MTDTPIESGPLVVYERSYFRQCEAWAAWLELETEELLRGLGHIDRIYFRAKSPTSFAEKCTRRNKDETLKYPSPFDELEDLVGGRVLVHFLTDIEKVRTMLEKRFTRIQHETKEPEHPSSFGYQSEHLICPFPLDMPVQDWNGCEPPRTFELQVRTLFMHAWAEPQHDLVYHGGAITPNHEKLVAWAASNAWGGDRIMQELYDEVSNRNGDGAQREGPPSNRKTINKQTETETEARERSSG